MKVLFLSNNPERSSFRQRFTVYLDVLKSKGINYDIAVIPSGLMGRYKTFKKAQNYDSVILHKKGLNPISAYLLRKFSKKIIFNYDDAVMFKDSKPDKKSLSHLLPFNRSVRISDNVLVGSEYLAAFARKLGTKATILPLGLEFDKYFVDDTKVDDGKIRLVWIGSDATLMYLWSLKNTLEMIGRKYPNVVLRIIGDSFFDLENMEVEKFKWQKDKRGEYLSACDIGLVPLPDNNFTQGKCTFKCLEYASAKLCSIASPVGTNTVHIIDGKTGYFAKNSQEWEDCLSQLIEDESLRKQMGQAAYDIAQDYSIEKIGPRLAEFIRSVL